MNTAFIKIGVGLLLLILANIILGSVTAIIGGSWSWKKFWRGVYKGLIIVLALILVYIAGYLNPDMIVIPINDQKVNLMSAILLILTSAFIWYGRDVITKLKDILLKQIPESISPALQKYLLSLIILIQII